VTLYKNVIKKYGNPHVKYTGDILISSTINKIDIAKFIYYWDKSQHYSWPNQPWYTGTGLQYNKNLNIKPYSKQICGNHSGIPEYNDTLSFDQHINKLLFKSFPPFYCVRSKITCLVSSESAIERKEDWHRDESCFEALRVIIPLETDTNYCIQLDNHDPVNLKVGKAYAFDQSTYHRVLTLGRSSKRRLHLITSIVTLLDRKKDDWIPNSNYSIYHPLIIFKKMEF
jgi:hypothetical protein